jgi:hypothetical protein
MQLGSQTKYKPCSYISKQRHTYALPGSPKNNYFISKKAEGIVVENFWPIT